MGALSAPTNWLVEDDVLLKNAIETGASLESLSKGAVCFSRKFTLQELQDRWYSLLYDSEISAQASARMIEYEIELSNSNPAKAHKLFSSKAKDFSLQKRKIESVKHQYYAMRKRVCNEPCDTADLGFLVAPCSCIATGGECVCGGLLKPSQGHHVVHNIDPVANAVNSYGQPGGSYNVGQHVYPEIDGRSFHIKNAGVAEGVMKDGNSNNECRYGYTGVGNIVSLKGIPNFQEPMHFQQVSARNRCGGEAIETKTLVGTNQDGVKQDHFCGNNNGRLQEPTSLQVISQPQGSQAPSVPVWSTVQAVNVPKTLTNMHIKEKEREVLTIADDKKMNTVNSDALTLQENLDGGICNSTLDNATMSEGEFMDFPLMDFSNSEDFELLNGENFLNSPLETNQHYLDDPDSKAVLEASSSMHNLAHSDGADMCCDQNVAGVSGIILVPSSSEVSYHSQNVECRLNTEDTEIPCNDDIIIPGQPPLQCPTSTLENSGHDICPVSSAITLPSNAEHSNAIDLALVKMEDTATVQPSSQPMKLNSSIIEQEEGIMAFNKGCVVGAKLSEGPSTGDVLVHGSIDSSDANTSHPINTAEFAEESPCGLGQHESFANSQNLTLDKSVQVPNHMNYSSHNNQPEIGDIAALQNCMLSHVPDLGLQNSIVTMPTSGQAEEGSDNENDVPNYYDIEALILEQDLVPWDQESDFIHPEVSRFQCPESRKALIRLEQGAQSYMNRAIMSRGAFAVIYGLHLKYYIKDPEVTLGRETEDVKVDIDLGKEGRANKISRRQAVIKMDEGGTFHIKNIGKCSIFVNSKEVPSNNRINLSADSLIEIKDMRFIFHVNQDAVKQHIIRAERSCSQNSRFDWV